MMHFLDMTLPLAEKLVSSILDICSHIEIFDMDFWTESFASAILGRIFINN